MAGFHRMVPDLLVVPSILKVWMGWGSFFRGKLARNKSLRSMKLPVAPKLIRAVVLTICSSMSSLTGKQRVCSLAGATNTWEMTWEGNIKVASQFKNLD